MDNYSFGKSFSKICQSLISKDDESSNVENSDERAYGNFLPNCETDHNARSETFEETDEIQPSTSQINKSLNYEDSNITSENSHQHLMQAPEVEPLDLSKRLSQDDQNLNERLNSFGYSIPACSYSRNSVTTQVLNSSNGKSTKTPYSSKKCDTFISTFTKQNQLQLHGAKKGLHKCERCSKEFKKKTNLTIHMRIHTGEKPYKCINCDFACVQKSTLTSHIRIHTSEKPYKCINCDYACVQKSTLTRQRIHTGDKPYKCDTCDYASAQKSNLNKHTRKHNKETI